MQAKAAGRAERDQSPNAIAHYIANLTGELAQLARGNGLYGLAYILDMARLEADQVAKGSEDSKGAVGSNGRAA
jgi:NTP pyrophosphatase (non-canonical NTP hydrolase)